jgi:K+-transporting ATPase ATPase C chain
MNDLRKQLVPALLVTLVLTVLLGLVYPLTVTALAQILYPYQANGSLVFSDGKVVGSKLLGRAFSGAGTFHSRPSAAGSGYDPTATSGTNLGPTSRKLIDQVTAATDQARKENPGRPVPADLVTSSASGLDPHITPAAAEFQVPRVAREWGLAEAEVRRLVAAHTEGRQLGVLGEPRVNVLELNLALDALHPH